MKGNRAERTAAETAAVMRDGKLHFAQSRNAADLVIARMPRTRIRQCIHLVHILARQQRRRRILHNLLVIVVFHNGFAVHGTLVVILDFEGFGVLFLIGLQLVVFIGIDKLKFRLIVRLGGKDRAADAADFFNRHALIEHFGDRRRVVFAHAVKQNIRAGINQNAAAHLVVPIVVMRKPS